MSRKPINNLSPSETRDGIWKLFRAKKTLTQWDIELELKLDPNSIRAYLTGLCNAKYIEKTGTTRIYAHNSSTYKLVKDIGIDAPRVRTDGTHVTQGQGNINLWRTMRILKAFTATDLAINASTEDCQIKENTAKKYCQALAKAKYLKMTGGKGGAPGAYRLMKYTGPKPPQIQRVQQIFDPNLKEVVWSAKGGNHE